MKKLWVILCFVILLCLCSCSENQKSDNNGNSTQDVMQSTDNGDSSTQNVTQSAEVDSLQPYWDTHADEIGSYAGLVRCASQRFSGDFKELLREYQTKDGDVMFYTPMIHGLNEKKGEVNKAQDHYVTGPQTWWQYYYDNSSKQIYSIYDVEHDTDADGYDVLSFKRGKTFYSETDYEWTDGYYTVKIDTDDKFVVMQGIPADDSNPYLRFYWKKNAGLIGIFEGCYNEDGTITCYTNLRYTSRTADGWNMAGTLEPYPFPGSKPQWPDKLWPNEYKGLNDPELREILEQY